ncbi:MAG: site-specific DNA-methyltransferase [Gammaproteobacteria bacterium]|nr:site-specific DNA-methyltransferase [Gammaproteobacteria bacterium]
MPRSTPKPPPRDYRHGDKKALLRPEGGSQDMFPSSKKKGPKSYRYDSSLAPTLAWDEAQARSEGERLIGEIIDSDSLNEARRAAEKLKNMSRPFLDWAGKAEREKISVPTLPLFVHERLSTEAVLKTLKRHKRDRQQTLDLFGEGEKSIGEKIRGAYEHMNGWQNRLILGDSLQIMNSLLEYENMGGQVQMVYMDPPYGVKYGSNFQPFVRNREVKDGDDDNISREPEMVQAYRDTWELGTHSWLTYMRDRLFLARDLLTESGSCFVQISDENVHLVRNIMDEVFGRENFVSLISYATTSGLGNKNLETTGDYLVWFAKDIDKVKTRKIWLRKAMEPDGAYRHVELQDGTRRAMTKEEREGRKALPDECRVFRYGDLRSQTASKGGQYSIEFEGRTFEISKGSWKTGRLGMDKLIAARRIGIVGKNLGYIRYLHDFPCKKINNMWPDTGIAGYASDKQYVVETSAKVIQRCLLMTTDPGDLIFDPTCGGGTSAFVAEKWGRRWITSDISRVPLALTRQRLLTATYPYYQLKDGQRGPGAGFVYIRKKNAKGEEVGGIVPRITLKSIANDEPPVEEVLVDQPEVDRKVTRISGPFCVEAVLPIPVAPDVASKDEVEGVEPQQTGNRVDVEGERDHIERMIEILRLVPTIRLPDNKTFKIKNIRPPAKSLNLHAEAESADDSQLLAIVFGPANGAISERSVVDAGREARNKDYAQLLVIAFAIEPAARETIEHSEESLDLPSTYVQASTDVVMSDLLKNMRSSQIFSVCGLPDIELRKVDEKTEEGDQLWQVELLGLDVFDPANMEVDSRQGDDVPCWMLDPDYDGQCFRAGQVFFPRTGAWEKIRKAVKADFDDTVWDHLRGSVSAPFIAGEQVAVKVIDDRGNELMVIKKVTAK